jgi:hypothetical protein
MCASYGNAIKIALANADRMQGVGSIDPRALQGYLIRPVQRICKYPLLLKVFYYNNRKFSSLVVKGIIHIVMNWKRPWLL